MPNPKIVILGTGGTIAGEAAESTQGVGYRAGQISVQGLIAAVPDLPRIAAGCTGAVLDAVQLAQVDSKDMDWRVWRTLLKATAQALDDADIQALVITHGTDTLEETAWLLQVVLQPGKPVVLTCAMRPATSLQADGPQNLRDAVAVAAAGRCGVWVAAAGEVHAARQVLKAHPYRLNAMHSYEGGPCAYVEEGRVRWVVTPATACSAWPQADLQALLGRGELPWVEVLQSGAVQSARAVNALVAAGVQGLVVAGTGNATVHQQLLQALLQARERGVMVWCTTRCLEGQAVGQSIDRGGPAADDVGETCLMDEINVQLCKAADAQALDCVLLAPSKARVAMMLQLARNS